MVFISKIYTGAFVLACGYSTIHGNPEKNITYKIPNQKGGGNHIKKTTTLSPSGVCYYSWPLFILFYFFDKSPHKHVINISGTSINSFFIHWPPTPIQWPRLLQYHVLYEPIMNMNNFSNNKINDWQQRWSEACRSKLHGELNYKFGSFQCKTEFKVFQTTLWSLGKGIISCARIIHF